jgi:UDP-N-acetyl-D-mannosaminuronate dehydrogenase
MYSLEVYLCNSNAKEFWNAMAEKIVAVGVGKVGLPLALVMARHFEVKAVDVISKAVNWIKNCVHFTEKNVNKYRELYADSFEVSTDFNLPRGWVLIFVVFGTQNEGYATGSVKSALKDSISYLTYSNQVLVVVSTVTPIDMNSKITPFLSHLNVIPKIEGICYNPAMIALALVSADQYPI